MISIVIPAYNEEKIIAETVLRVKKSVALIGVPWELVIVDDGSSDKTATILEQLDIILVKHPHNIGYGLSLKDGINRAQYDTIIILDADGTYPIEEIPQLYQEYRKGFNMVVAQRTGKYYQESFGKRLLRFVLKALVEFAAGRKILDINSGMRVFSKKEIKEFFPYLCNTFSFTTSLTLAYMLSSFFVKYIPVTYHRRVGKSKVKLFKDSLRTMQFIVEAILHFNPLKIFIVFATFLFILSLISFIFFNIWHFQILLFITVSLILLSLLIFGLGMHAVILSKILKQRIHLIKD